MASPPGSGGQPAPSANASVGDADVRKSGYLRKQKHGHKRFFVLRAAGDVGGGGTGGTGAGGTGGAGARLEYYESEKKWRNRAAAKRVIPLDSCLNINKRADAKHRHLIALYTKDEYFAVAAENEQEQEDWYGLLSELMLRGRLRLRLGDGGAATHSASSLLGFDEGSYGMIAPASAAYKEVWQVTLKSRGLGQSRNLTGVYRLCLSSRAISFVKLNSEAAAVVLQLANVRRCGHSDSFFFVEVGRSAATGPGELWMQADDAVVAQNIHETVLEAMKAMKELSEFRPRSKSQSSSTNPISVPGRRHLNNLPPSQTGLLRRSRTDGAAAASPAGKLAPCRIRTASEGDGTAGRSLSVSSGSPISPGNGRAPLNRSNTLASRPCRPFEPAVLQHSKSMSMPVSRSPPSAPSSLSLSSGSGNGSASDAHQRPAGDCASVSGSPSDAGFISCDEYGSSPGDPRQRTAHGGDTPDFAADTPSSRGSGDLDGYVPMERPCGDPYPHGWPRCRDDARDLEKAYRKRTYSLTTPPQQRAPSQASSASLDEYTLMRATCADGHLGRNSHAASLKVAYPEDYGDVEIGSSRSSGSNPGDDGYMAMSPGVAPSPGSRNENYMPMSPMTVSAPKQIINPRVHGQTVPNSYRVTSPGSCSLEDSGYMRMLCGPRLSADSSDGKLPGGEYINMSPVEPCVSLTPPDGFLGFPAGESLRGSSCPFSSLPRFYKPQMASRGAEGDQYVMMMSLQGQRIPEELSSGAEVGVPATAHAGHSRGGCRVNRPTRLPLDTVRTLPCMTEHPQPTEPRSPGEYINLDFGDGARCSPPPLPAGTPVSGARRHSPLSDYMNVDVGLQSPGSRVTPSSRLDTVSETVPCPRHPDESGCPAVQSNTAKKDYTEMSFGSPSSGVQRLTLGEQNGSGVEAFLLPAPAPDPDRGAKVIRADPQGRRRHSSETFSSTTTVMPVFPSFAHDAMRQSSASVENVWARGGGSEGSDEDGGSSMRRETSAGFQNGLNYIALNLMDEKLGSCKNLVKLRAAGASCCKAGVGGLHGVSYASFAFKETAATVKD